MATILDPNSMTVWYNFPVPENSSGYLINPDLSAVSGLDPMFWVVSGDTVSPMGESQINTLYLAGAITTVCNNINTFRDNLLNAGFNYNGTLYDSDQQSIQNIAGTQTFIASGGTLPPAFVWRTVENTNTSFNNTTFTEFYMTSVAWVEAIWAVSWAQKSAVAAMTDYATVMAYNFSTGWPTGWADATGVTFT
jgi:hypothetical protein